ncbi:MAG: TetR/AcrR family transcriptional regulator [Xanthobacteraceae bacterium]|nr:TetR/AcrR family transcriptional regulator [Xanthobacteraceae bacterium]
MAKGKGDRTRTQIIEGAVRALSATGVQGATTRKIAAEAGVQLATLHYHFDSKSSLLLAVLESLIDEMTRALRDEVRTSTDLGNCVEQILQATWRWIMRTRVLQIVQYELTLYALREGAAWLAERQYDAYVQLYLDLLRSAPAGTEDLTAAECRAVAHFMLAGVDGLILQELAKPNRARSRRGIEALTRSTRQYLASIRDSRPPRADARDAARSAAAPAGLRADQPAP